MEAEVDIDLLNMLNELGVEERKPGELVLKYGN